MRRSKIWGYLSVILSGALIGLFIYSIIIIRNDNFSLQPLDLHTLSNYTFYSISIPIYIVTIFIIGTGFWIGWTILTIKVVPPMAEIVEKKDYSKIKAFFLCILSLFFGIMLVYGLYNKNFWALAIPAGVISLVILGAVFWVGIAIITTRTTLPQGNKES